MNEPVRLCVDCKAHRAITDGNRCTDCLAAYLRQTRPAVISPWVKRALANELPPRAA